MARFMLYISAMRIICFLLAFCLALPASASVRIKDIVHFEGVRDNLLVGYGLVVGLNGTGDKLNNTAFTEQSLKAFLERLGVNSSASQLKTKNIAAVTVTAQLPAFARNGGTIDVSVSTIGDAKSIQGGVLLATPLLGADGEVYAVAQGSVSSGAVAAGAGASVTKGVPTSGTIAGGAIVEREIDFKLNAMSRMNISLKNPDFTTANRVSNVINGKLGKEYASVLDPATIQLNIPEANTGKVATLIGELESLTLETDQPAKIVIDEASGTIVMGENVRIDTVAIAQGNLIVRVEEKPQVSQPGLLAPEGAQTVVTPETTINVEEDKGKKSIVMEKGATLNDLVKGLNSLGVGPRDLIAILQAIKTAGALQAEIETR